MNALRYAEMTIACQGINLIIADKGASSDYIVMTQEIISPHAYPQPLHDVNGNPLFIGEEYIIITCANGHMYYVNVTMDSVITACA